MCNRNNTNLYNDIIIWKDFFYQIWYPDVDQATKIRIWLRVFRIKTDLIKKQKHLTNCDLSEATVWLWAIVTLLTIFGISRAQSIHIHDNITFSQSLFTTKFIISPPFWGQTYRFTKFAASCRQWSYHFAEKIPERPFCLVGFQTHTLVVLKVQ